MKEHLDARMKELQRKQANLQRELQRLQEMSDAENFGTNAERAQELEALENAATDVLYAPPVAAVPVRAQSTGELPIYTLDIETDPFEYGRDPQPFACGFYTGDQYFDTWGDDCIDQMQMILQTVPPGIVYAHNGGKFDVWYLMHWIANDEQLMIVNGRIVRCKFWRNDNAYHEFRDSYALMPFALKKYKKDEIDVRTFEKKYREKNKDKIRGYLRGDCVYLHELCVSFRERFGDNLTIGSTSMKELRKLHEFDCLTSDQDEMIRTRFYYGGRVECFEKGVIKPTRGNKISAYDLNQCYPYSMRNFDHPIGIPNQRITNEITNNTAFLTVYGRNYGAFPIRTEHGLRFDVAKGIFSITRHEFDAAIETGMFELESVLETIDFERWGNFATFVDTFHHLRRDAQLRDDKIGALFYKYVCNSAYGKFAQSPDNYYNYKITSDRTNLNPTHNPDGYFPCTIVGFAGYIVWRKHAYSNSRFNVATGASITGAARSLLIHALAKAKRPLYCDTDSIMCESLSGVPIDDTQLGAWKIEKSGNKMAIAGRKLYALFDKGKCVKQASKGVQLSPEQILDIAHGAEIEYKKDAPTFNMKTHEVRYIKRRVRMT